MNVLKVAIKLAGDDDRLRDRAGKLVVAAVPSNGSALGLARNIKQAIAEVQGVLPPELGYLYRMSYKSVYSDDVEIDVSSPKVDTTLKTHEICNKTFTVYLRRPRGNAVSKDDNKEKLRKPPTQKQSPHPQQQQQQLQPRLGEKTWARIAQSAADRTANALLAQGKPSVHFVDDDKLVDDVEDAPAKSPAAVKPLSPEGLTRPSRVLFDALKDDVPREGVRGLPWDVVLATIIARCNRNKEQISFAILLWRDGLLDLDRLDRATPQVQQPQPRKQPPATTAAMVKMPANRSDSKHRAAAALAAPSAASITMGDGGLRDRATLGAFLASLAASAKSGNLSRDEARMIEQISVVLGDSIVRQRTLHVLNGWQLLPASPQGRNKCWINSVLQALLGKKIENSELDRLYKHVVKPWFEFLSAFDAESLFNMFVERDEVGGAVDQKLPPITGKELKSVVGKRLQSPNEMGGEIEHYLLCSLFGVGLKTHSVDFGDSDAPTAKMIVPVDEHVRTIKPPATLRLEGPPQHVHVVYSPSHYDTLLVPGAFTLGSIDCDAILAAAKERVTSLATITAGITTVPPGSDAKGLDDYRRPVWLPSRGRSAGGVPIDLTDSQGSPPVDAKLPLGAKVDSLAATVEILKDSQCQQVKLMQRLFQQLEQLQQQLPPPPPEQQQQQLPPPSSPQQQQLPPPPPRELQQQQPPPPPEQQQQQLPPPPPRELQQQQPQQQQQLPPPLPEPLQLPPPLQPAQSSDDADADSSFSAFRLGGSDSSASVDSAIAALKALAVDSGELAMYAFQLPTSNGTAFYELSPKHGDDCPGWKLVDEDARRKLSAIANKTDSAGARTKAAKLIMTRVAQFLTGNCGSTSGCAAPVQSASPIATQRKLLRGYESMLKLVAPKYTLLKADIVNLFTDERAADEVLSTGPIVVELDGGSQ